MFQQSTNMENGADSSAHSKSGLWRLALCAIGICSCFLHYGYIIETLFAKEQERLGASFVVFTQCVSNTLVALLWQRIAPGKEQHQNQQKHASLNPLHHSMILAASLCYVGAMATSNEAVAYVSYPVAVLAKSCKLIPTMLVGQFIEGKFYSQVEWLAAVLISVGIVLFHWTRLTPESSESGEEEDTAPYGMMLLTLSLCLDGALAAFQNVLKRPSGYRPPSAMETMLWMNFYASFLFVPLCLVSGQWVHGFRLLYNQPSKWLYKILWLNGAVAVGQIFIFLTIVWYSPVVTTTLTTTRKFGTILLSVWTYGHSFSFAQWTAIGLVFLGLYLAIWVVANQKKGKKARTE